MAFFQDIPGVNITLSKPPTSNHPNTALDKYSIAKARLQRPRNICPYCRNLRYPTFGSARIPTRIEDLEKSANGGKCFTCGLLLGWCDRLLGQEDRVKASSITLDFGDLVKISVDFIADTPSAQFELHVTSDRPSLWKTIEPAPRVPGDTQSDLSLLWVLEQIRDCSRFHKFCPKLRPKPLPTRVLDLGLPNWPKDASEIMHYLSADLRLHEPDANGLPENYVCLSHCWGQDLSMLLRTTISNIAEHQQRIRWSSLPKTFQDAVIFTRKLRVRYLWIDSLCIVQDDKDDWRREAGKMCSVFQGSLLTLCATASPGPTDGLFTFSSRDESKDPRSRRIETEPWEVYARRPLFHLLLPTTRNFPRGSPLLKRGWVFQERLLAERVLHFGPQELIWECSQKTDCECAQIDAYQPKQHHLKALQSRSPSQITRRWHEVVEEYSMLSLTYESDRLLALAGLAEQFRSYKSFRFLAGLWESSIIQDLLWEANGDRLRPESRQMPTWSWTSVEGHVTYPPEYAYEDMEIQAEVLHISSTAEGRHPLHKDTLGCITLRGLLVPVDHNSEQAQSSRPTYQRLSVHKKGFLEPIWINADYKWYEEGSEKITFQDKLFLFMLASLYSQCYCLVLKQVESLPDTFERIGIINSFQEGVGHAVFGESEASCRVRII